MCHETINNKQQTVKTLLRYTLTNTNYKIKREMEKERKRVIDREKKRMREKEIERRMVL